MELPGLSLSLGRGSSLDSFGLDALNRSSRIAPTMTPEEEDSLAMKVGKGGLGMLSAVGNLLDVPGSMVRDTLAGQNPFDQILSPFSDENRTTGRDLLRKYGMVGQKDTWGNFFGGMAAEIALDPTTYLSLGTSALSKTLLTNSGRIATRAGATADDLVKAAMKAGRGSIGKRLAAGTTTLGEWLDYGDDTMKALKKADADKAFKAMYDAGEITGTLDNYLNEPLQTLGRVSVPGTNWGVNFGSIKGDGTLARYGRILADQMDKAGVALKSTFPVRAARYLFDSSAGGVLDFKGQELAEQADAAKKLGRSEAYQNYYTAVQDSESVLNQFINQYGGAITAGPGESLLAKQIDTFKKVVRMTADTNGDFRTAMQTVLDVDPDADDFLKEFTAKIRSTVPGQQQDMADGVAFVWKAFAEGYRGEKAGDWLKQNVADLRQANAGQVGPEALFQSGKEGVDPYRLRSGAPDPVADLRHAIDAEDAAAAQIPNRKLVDQAEFEAEYWRAFDATKNSMSMASIHDVKQALRQRFPDMTSNEFRGHVNVMRRNRAVAGVKSEGSFKSWTDAEKAAGFVEDPGNDGLLQPIMWLTEISRKIQSAPGTPAPRYVPPHLKAQSPPPAPERSAAAAPSAAIAPPSSPDQKINTQTGTATWGELQDRVKQLYARNPQMTLNDVFLVADLDGVRGKAMAQALFDQVKGKGPGKLAQSGGRGAVEFLEDGKAVISIFNGGDVSTHLHEFSHVARRHLKEEDLATANKWVGAAEGQSWTRDQEEMWAKGFEEYVRSGTAPNDQVKTVFERLQDWVVKVYRSIAGTPYAAQIPDDIKELYGKLIGQESATPAAKLKKGVVTLGQEMQAVNDAVMKDILNKGGRVILLEAMDQDVAAAQLLGGDPVPGFKHFPSRGKKQFITPTNALELNQRQRMAPTSFGNMMSRQEVTRHIPREVVNIMANDDMLRNGTEIEAAHALASNPGYAKYLGRTEEFAGQNDRHALEIVQYLRGRKKGDVYDTAATFDDYLHYQQKAHTVSRSLTAILEFMAHNRMWGDDGNTLSFAEALRGSNMDADRAAEYVATLMTRDNMRVGATKKLILEEMRVAPEVAQAVRTFLKPISEPWGKELGKVADEVNNLFKGWLTLPFPGFQGRNWLSGLYANTVMSGAIQSAADAWEYFASYKDVLGMAMQGDNRAARELAQEMAALRAIDTRSVAEGVEVTESLGGKISPPALPFINPGDSWKRATGRVGDFMAEYPIPGQGVPGVSTGRVAAQTVLEEGGKVAGLIEWANRGSMYHYLKKKGYSPEAAASMVRKLHVDYGDLTPFEKTVMRRLAPFYTFQKNMAPVIFQTLWQRPGGGLSQTIQGITSLQDTSDPLIPDYVSQTASIPLGESEPGTKKFLTGFGLPFEQTFAFGDGGIRGSLREMASQLTPAIKAPLEYATNQSFFQAGPGGAGRSLEDLNPTIGQTLANLLGTKEPVDVGRGTEFVLGASPASRFLTSARKLTDPRKSMLEKVLSFGTGVSTTDVSPGAQDAILRERSRDVMRDLGAKAYERVYFPAWMMEREADPDRRRQMESLNMLQTVLASRARRRAEQMRAQANGQTTGARNP